MTFIAHTSALDMTQLSNVLITDNCVNSKADVWVIKLYHNTMYVYNK